MVFSFASAAHKHPANFCQQQQPSHTAMSTNTDRFALLCTKGFHTTPGIPTSQRRSRLLRGSSSVTVLVPFLVAKTQLETPAFTIGITVSFSPLVQYFCVWFYNSSKMLQNILYPKRVGLNAPAKMLLLRQPVTGLYEKCPG